MKLIIVHEVRHREVLKLRVAYLDGVLKKLDAVAFWETLESVLCFFEVLQMPAGPL